MSFHTSRDNPGNPPEANPRLSSTGAEDIAKIGQWIDHREWDVLDNDAVLRRDNEICLQLLELGSEVIVQSFGMSLDSSAVSPPNAEGKSSSDITVLEARYGQPNPVTDEFDSQSSARFLNPERIGAGAFGIVFRVTDQRLGIQVAIKILRPSKSNSRDLRIRFLGEAQTTAALSHAGIVRIYDTGQIGSLPYITSAYVEGGSLATWLSKNRSNLSWRQAAQLFSSIADAVHYAHSKATLHRDLKPGNILLEPMDTKADDQVGLRPLLTDFGLAKRLDREMGAENLTLEGGLLGTTRYMSPEQARGASSEVGTTSDIFSLGIILYEMLVGCLPFEGSSADAIRKQIIEAAPKRPRSIVPAIPRDLEAIVLKCLEKRPSNRYQSAHELWLDLNRFLNGRPIEASPPSLVRSALFAIQSHPVMTFVIGSLLAINFAAIFISVRASYREKEAVQSSMSIISSFFSNFGDKVYSGSRITPYEFLETLEPSIKFATEQVEANPGDFRFAHKLSVMKHFSSIGHCLCQNYDLAIQEREEVIELLEQLLASQPDHPKLRFQLFNSHKTLGDLRATVANESDPSKNPGLPSIERALEEINALVADYPDDVDYVDYVDAQNATKRSIVACVSTQNPKRAIQLLDEVIASSERLWRQFPDRPLLAKHAIGGGSCQSSVYIQFDDLPRAYETAMQAVALSDEAWGKLPEEGWIVEETAAIFEMAAFAMLMNGKHAGTLAMLKRGHKRMKEFEGIHGNADAIRVRRFGLYAMQIKAAKAAEDAASLTEGIDAAADLLQKAAGGPQYESYESLASAPWATCPELERLIAENYRGSQLPDATIKTP